jgi:hypothetical protein
MATRRTIPSTPDMLGRDVSPGDAVAIAVSTAYGSRSAEQRLVRVEKIYLDDSSGTPYGSSYICFRAPNTQHLFQTAPDIDPASRAVTDHTTGLPVDGTSWVPTIVTDSRRLGYGYSGAYQIVYYQEVRIVGATIDHPGAGASLMRRTRSTYETSEMIRIDETSLAAVS